MRVISTPETEKEIECPHCHALLGYLPFDVFYKCEEYFGELYDCSYIICPICRKRVVL